MNSFIAYTPKDPNAFSPINSLPIFPANAFASLNSSPQVKVPNLSGLLGLADAYSPTARTRASSINSLSSVNSYSPISTPSVPVNSELNSILLSWKLQQNYQNELFKTQMQQLLEIKNTLLEKLNQQDAPESKAQASIQIPALRENFETEKVKVEALSDPIPQFSPKTFQSGQKKALKAQVRDIVDFVLDNFGRISESRFDEEKARYADNKDLQLVFELLTSKYASTIKTKEEMVKYTLRRAFKYIKNTLKKETNANTKRVSQAICNKYFKTSQDEISKAGNEEDLLKVVLPFRKNSKNKTMNTNFINEVFASEDFCRDYEKYLKSFDGILEADNKGKIERLVTYIEDCIKKGKIKDIKNYKRIPWPKLWIANTKNIAQSLPTMGTTGLHSPSEATKKVKKDMSPNGQRSSEDECNSEASTDSTSNY